MNPAGRRRGDVVFFILIAAAAGIVFFLHQPTRREILPVAGNHFYLGRQIYRGDLLYRDIFIDKPPLT
ncbi:MAG: hypothetical protein P9M08_02790, partial [Candidatus Erginobacter occultus]|nr:hypothetical protein [Candidatus Erginobacter occultus]